MSLADTITETDLEPKKKPGRPPNKPEEAEDKPKGDQKVLPLNFATNSKLVKDDGGYHYDNVHIPHEFPSYALAVIAESKIPESSIADFTVVKGMLASANIAQSKATRIHNGIVVWPGNNFTIPSIGTEVYLRIIEDRIKTDPVLKKAFIEPERVHMFKRMQTVINSLQLVN